MHSSVPSTSAVAISFCTTCFNRLRQFRQTFDANAEAVSKAGDVEWIILNYSGTDDLHEFMMNRLAKLPRRVIYAKDTAKRPWHSSVAKNMAHRLGSGRMLMNLDCDNYIGNAIEIIKSHLVQGHKLLHLWTRTIGDGTFGRIAVERDLFYSLGGYDESFYPMAFQDGDLFKRAVASGVRDYPCSCPVGAAIKNTKEESMRSCAMDGLSWNDYDRMNQAKSAANIAARRLTANVEVPWAEMNPEIFTGQA
jgi:predicted glycosyltransferase involved in capsule biosynthesis